MRSRLNFRHLRKFETPPVSFRAMCHHVIVVLLPHAVRLRWTNVMKPPEPILDDWTGSLRGKKPCTSSLCMVFVSKPTPPQNLFTLYTPAHLALLLRCAIYTQYISRTFNTTTPTLGRAPFACACTAALPDLPSLQHQFHQRAHRDTVSIAEQISAPTPRLLFTTSSYT